MNAPSIQPLSAWLRPREALDGVSLMDHLFNRLDGAYPGRWKSAFPSTQSITNWREAWVEAFIEDGLQPSEIKAGIAACRKLYDWPPSIHEFIKACRPDVSEEAFRHAVALTSTPVDQRNYGADSVMYWAIQRFGEHELRTVSWDRAKERWRKIFESCRDENRRGMLPIIPERREALPSPGQASISPEEAAKRVKSLKLSLNPRGDKDWAHKIVARIASGENVSHQAQKMAEEVVAEQEAA